MAKIRNKTIHSEDRGYLQRLADELEFIGREYRLDLRAGTLTQYALPQRSKRKGKRAKKEARNKRAESAARRQQ